jgi:hypothetical protein
VSFSTPFLDISTMDNPAKEWCYLEKSITFIGIPFQPAVTTVTYDRAFYTGYAELCFFYGKKNLPLIATQKFFFVGWILMVEYTWKDEAIQYSIEMFAAVLDGHDASDSDNFIRLNIKNMGAKTEYYNFPLSQQRL